MTMFGLVNGFGYTNCRGCNLGDFIVSKAIYINRYWWSIDIASFMAFARKDSYSSGGFDGASIAYLTVRYYINERVWSTGVASDGHFTHRGGSGDAFNSHATYDLVVVRYKKRLKLTLTKVALVLWSNDDDTIEDARKLIPLEWSLKYSDPSILI